MIPISMGPSFTSTKRAVLHEVFSVTIARRNLFVEDLWVLNRIQSLTSYHSLVIHEDT